MKSWFFILSGCLLAAGCSSDGFQKGPQGLRYRHFQLGEGAQPEQGNYIKLQVKQLFNDTVVQDTRKSGPQYQLFDSLTLSKDSYAIMGKVSVGDSLIFKVPGDSVFKEGKKPPFYKKGGTLITYMKVLNIIRGEDSLKAERERMYGPDPREMQEQRGMQMPEGMQPPQGMQP